MKQYQNFFCCSIRHEMSLWDYYKPCLHLTACHSFRKCFGRQHQLEKFSGAKTQRATQRHLHSQEQLIHVFPEDPYVTSQFLTQCV